MRLRSSCTGFTAIELLIVVVLIGVLAGMALPAYRAHVLRANRAEARAALLALATTQEKFYLQCHTYAAALDGSSPTSCSPVNLRFPETSERGYYAIEVNAATAGAWSATASAVATGPQHEDRKCRVFRLNSQGLKTARDATDASSGGECWSR